MQVRLVFAEAGIEFVDDSFDMKSEESKQAFFAKCRGLGGNLTTNIPMVFIDGQYITQSLAVLKYLARKYGLYPSDAQGQYVVDNLIETANDLRSLNYKGLVRRPAQESQATCASLKCLVQFLDLSGDESYVVRKCLGSV